MPTYTSFLPSLMLRETGRQAGSTGCMTPAYLTTNIMTHVPVAPAYAKASDGQATGCMTPTYLTTNIITHVPVAQPDRATAF